MPATLATLAHPEIKGLYYLDLDAVIRFPWMHNGEPGITGKLLQEHQNGYSAVAFSRGSKANRFHRLRWQVHGERFYARDSAKGRAFFADCCVEIKFWAPHRAMAWRFLVGFHTGGLVQ